MKKILSQIARTLSGTPKPVAPTHSKQDELSLLINSRHPIITVETKEEGRLEQLLFDVATTLEVPLFTWSVTTGLARMKGSPLYNTQTPEQALTNIDLIRGDGIFVLKDFARYCDNDRVCRRLRELAEKCRAERRSIVITATAVQLPIDLQGDAVPFELGLAGAEELFGSVREVIGQANAEDRIPVALDGTGVRQLAQSLVGLPQEEAMRLLRKCILERRRVEGGLVAAVREAKRRGRGGIAAFAGMDCEAQERIDARRTKIWAGAAEGRVDHRRARVREEFGGAVSGGRIGLRTGATGCGSAVRQIRGRKREEAAPRSGPGGEIVADGVVDR